MNQQEIKFKCLELAAQIIQNNLSSESDMFKLAERIYGFTCDVKAEHDHELGKVIVDAFTEVRTNPDAEKLSGVFSSTNVIK